MPKAAAAKTVQIPAGLIDAFAEAKKLHDDFASTEAQYQKLYRQLKLIADTMPDDAEAFIDGTAWSLEISERGMVRFVDVTAARKRLSAQQFLEVVTITQSALNEILPKPEVEALLLESQTGPRKFTTSAKVG